MARLSSEPGIASEIDLVRDPGFSAIMHGKEVCAHGLGMDAPAGMGGRGGCCAGRNRGGIRSSRVGCGGRNAKGYRNGLRVSVRCRSGFGIQGRNHYFHRPGDGNMNNPLGLIDPSVSVEQRPHPQPEVRQDFSFARRRVPHPPFPLRNRSAQASAIRESQPARNRIPATRRKGDPDFGVSSAEWES